MKLISTIRFVFVCILASGFVGQLVAQTPSLEALGRQGPYQVAWYTQLPSVTEFSGATLYFPANKAQDFGGVVISPDSLRDRKTSAGGVIIWLPMDLR